MSSPAFCNLCNRNVVPVKPFNWLLFIFLCGCFYLPFYLMQSKKCPICQGQAFGPAQAEEIGSRAESQTISDLPNSAIATRASAITSAPLVAAEKGDQPAAKVAFCPNCGVATKGTTFCTECGTKL